MSQSNETPQEVLLKVKKIKALAERGIGGEKEAARKLLAALCAKYGISEEEIHVLLPCQNFCFKTLFTSV